MTLDELVGEYRVDIDSSARLMAGGFHQRFTMKGGYDDALLKSFRESAMVFSDLRLQITSTDVVLRSSEGEDRIPISSFGHHNDNLVIGTDWHGIPQQFEIIKVADDTYYFRCEGNSLSQVIWYREGAKGDAEGAKGACGQKTQPCESSLETRDEPN